MANLSESCERHLEAGRRALSLGDTSTAEVELRAAIADAESAGGSPNQLGAAVTAYAQLLYHARRFGEAAPHFRRALELRERDTGSDDPALVPALHNLAAVHLAAGSAAEAEPLLRRGLAILERSLGTEHPELAGLLNGLSQLYLKRGAFAEAEPLLKRLLAIRSAGGGEERPEVATVMASLATVHTGLAEYDAAERLWRRVLEIRERTLAPNHFAIATAIESLAETCATRGKLDEALALYERALEMREHTLGSSHPSLELVRSKIADLQLQLSQDTFAVPLMEPVVEPARTPAVAPRPRLTEFRPPAETRPVAERPADVAETMRRLAGELDAHSSATPVVERDAESNLSVAILPTGSALVLPGAERAPLARTAADAVPDDDEIDFDALAADAPRPSIFSRPAVRVGLAAGLLVLLAGTGALFARGGADDGGVSDDGFVSSNAGTSPAGERSMAAGTIALPPADSVGAAAAHDTSTDRATASDRDTDRPTAPRRSEARQPDARPSRSTSEAPAVPGTPAPISERLLGGVTVPAAKEAPSIQVGDPATLDPSRALRSRATTPLRVYDAQPGTKPAFLIGTPPEPRYPAALRRAQRPGEVLVSFIVDTSGRADVSSVRIISASDVAFVSPVSDLLPDLRFIAAESAGVKIPQRVEMRFRFTPER